MSILNQNALCKASEASRASPSLGREAWQTASWQTSRWIEVPRLVLLQGDEPRAARQVSQKEVATKHISRGAGSRSARFQLSQRTKIKHPVPANVHEGKAEMKPGASDAAGN